MNRILSAATLLAATLLAAGCAAPGDNAAQTRSSSDELVYRTGSNIPIRNATPLTKEEKDKQAEAARQILGNMPQTGLKPQ